MSTVVGGREGARLAIFASRIMQDFLAYEENFLLLNENFSIVSNTIIELRDLLQGS